MAMARSVYARGALGEPIPTGARLIKRTCIRPGWTRYNLRGADPVWEGTPPARRIAPREDDSGAPQRSTFSMAFQITYIPTNSSHMGKTLPVLRALREAGADLRILCLDELQVAPHHLLPQIQSTDFGYSCLLRGTYSPRRHWFPCAVQRRSIERCFDSFLGSDRSSLFLLADDTWVPMRLFARVLARRGIPSVLIADGIEPRFKPSYHLPARDKVSSAARRILYGWGPRGTSGVQRILAMTKTCGNVFRGHGIATEKIVVVGSPEFDRIAACRAGLDDAVAASAIRARLALDPDRPIVFYAHQGITGSDLIESVVWNLAAACGRIGASLLVKFHPRADEDPGPWRLLARRRGFDPGTVSFFKTECTSIEALLVCATCVTAFSTVALEAMIHRRPVVVLQYLPVRETLTLARDYGAALDVDDSGGLAEAIRSTVADPGMRARIVANAQEALRQEMYGLDGKSIHRTVEAILDLGTRTGSGR